MDWLTIAGIIAQEGLAVAEGVYNKWASGQMPTAQDFAELRAMGKTRPEDLVLKAAALANIPNTDPRVVALLALVAPIPGGTPVVVTPPPAPPA